MYQVPCRRSHIELEEKRSRFIAYTQKTSHLAAFKAFLAEIKSLHADARHWCYAFRIGNLIQAERGFSDDGEPNGTAGMPILNVLDHSDFSDTAIIVVRYFGGTKLGTGGLVRAYSQASSQLLRSIDSAYYEAQAEITLSCQFQDEHQLRYLIQKQEGRVLSVEYDHQVTLRVEINQRCVLALQESCESLRRTQHEDG